MTATLDPRRVTEMAEPAISIHRRENGIRAVVETIWPDRARRLRESMPRNRLIKKNKVSQYARMMLQGGFPVNGEAIIIDSNGRMVNGFHRCLACEEAGVPFTTLVVYGIAPEAIVTIDTGTSRSFDDAGRIEGRNDSKLAGAVATVWHRYMIGSPTSMGSQPSNAERRAIIDAHPQINVSADLANSLPVIRRWCKPSIQAFVHAFASINGHGGKADEYINMLDSGADIQVGNPILSLRRRLVDRTASQTMPAMHALAISIKALDALILGIEVKLVRWSPKSDEPFPRFHWEGK